MVGNRRWTDEERKTLEQHFANISSPKIAQALGDRSVRAVNDQAYRQGLRKTPERLAEMGREITQKARMREQG